MTEPFERYPKILYTIKAYIPTEIIRYLNNKLNKIIFPNDLVNILIKYSSKEMIIYLKNKYSTIVENKHSIFIKAYNWKKLYYELYGETEVKAGYLCPKSGTADCLKMYVDLYLIGLINRLNWDRETICEGKEYKIKLTNTGKVYVKGSNDLGQLGIGDKKIQKKWKLIKLEGRATQIDCGCKYSMILLENGKAFITGWNSDGQLGIGKIGEDKINIDIPQVHGVDIFDRHRVAINKWIEVCWKGQYTKDKIVQICGGTTNSLILLDTGRVLSAGLNGSGLGLSCGRNKWEELKLPEEAVKIECNYSESTIYLKNGDILSTSCSGEWYIEKRVD